MLMFMLFCVCGLMLYLGVTKIKNSVFNICMGIYYMRHIDELKEEIRMLDEREGKEVEHDEGNVALSVKMVLTENILDFILGVVCLTTVFSIAKLFIFV